MNTSNVVPPRNAAVRPPINFFERYLTLWVALCIVAGIALGQLLPGLFQRIGRIEYAQVKRELSPSRSLGTNRLNTKKGIVLSPAELMVGAEGLEPRPSPCKGETNLQVMGLQPPGSTS